MNTHNEPDSTSGLKNLTITVIYDNNPHKQGLITDWGFAALITGTEKTILFDTGEGSLLLDNMEKLAIEPDCVDSVVLSHFHSDHTGGLESFLRKNPDVTVYLPEAFTQKLKDNARSSHAEIIEIEQKLQICENVYTTGQIGKRIKEQCLVIKTNQGLIIITGCAHPGIIKVLDKVKVLVEDNILFVMGGFHLEWTTKGKIEKIISSFKQLGVSYVGPCHCSGNKARNLFEKHFGSNYVQIGAGKTITMADFQT